MSLAIGSAAGAVIDADPGNYLRLLNALSPGDIMNLAPGTYADGLALHGLSGDAHRPITIQGPAGKARAMFLGRSDANTISIVDSSYLVIRNLLLDGRGLSGDAVKAEGQSHWAHHITIENLIIRNYGADQQTVGISTQCPAWSWTIRGNTIIGAGTGMYLGRSDGTGAFFAGLIERNLVSDTLGYNIEIKHQRSRPADLDAPSGTHATVIRHNVLSKDRNASSGNLARPNLLVGHFPKTGPGSDDRYLIYGNFLYGNPTEALFQGEGNIALYANLFVNLHGDAVHIQPHNDVPRNVWIFHNTILAKSEGINLLGAPETYVRMFEGNLVFSDRERGGRAAGNVVGRLNDARRFLIDPFAPLGKLNLLPRSPLARPRIGLLQMDGAPDSDRDFDGHLFRRDEVGAYAGRRSVPLWWPELAIKPAPIAR